MFEKDAEEIANKRCHEIGCFGHCSFSSPKHHRCGEWHREYECALKGAESREKRNAELNKKLSKAEADYDKMFWNKNEIISKAKEIIENIIRVTWGEGWNYSLDWKIKAEQFLKEADE